ncbi:hypothetical protein BJX76DRAFT_354824 [Aspergillus varians]
MAQMEEARRQEASWAEQERKRQEGRQQLQALKDRVEPQDKWSDGLLQDILNSRHPDTCQWLLKRPDFLTWTSNTCESPIFWLTGQHGTGKSFLCGSAIQHTQKANGNGAVICEFLTKDYPISQIQILRNLAFQLLENLSLRTQELPKKLKKFSKIRKSDTSAFEKLIEATITELPMTFIFIDGVDEADYHKDTVHMTNLAMIQGKDSEIENLLRFLCRLVHRNPATTARLWVSTQWERSDLDWVDDHQQLKLSPEDTEHDINVYLVSTLNRLMGNNPDAVKLFVESDSLSKISGSFIWASALLHDLQKCAEDKEDLHDILCRVPATLEEQYRRILNRVIQRGNQTVKKEIPTWRCAPPSPSLLADFDHAMPLTLANDRYRVILSIVAFAKRPMRMSQLIEGISIFRTKHSANLDDDRRVSPQVILNSCMAFLQVLRKGPGLENAIVRICHSSARDFLIQQPISKEGPFSWSDGEQLIDSTIIRECCMRYLLQPKYNRPLVKISSTSFKSGTGEDMESHHFLAYAAKYWHLHFDSLSDEEAMQVPQSRPEISDFVINFLKSPNFVTCVQVQSLLVVGHFIQSFNPLTNRVDYAKRVFPNWLQDHDITYEYMDFASEWGELLQWGLFEKFNGEVDRCLWKSFGQDHFLYEGQSRYRHFQLSPTGPSVPSGEGVCRLQRTSFDGREALCTTLFREGSKVKVLVEFWDLLAHPAPRLKESATYTVPRGAGSMESYPMPCSRLFPLIPRLRSLPPPDSFQADIQSSVLRVGSQYFLVPRNSSGAAATTDLRRINLDGFWEYVLVYGPVRVVCRRRALGAARPSWDAGNDGKSDYDSGLEATSGFDSPEEILSQSSAWSNDGISIASAVSLEGDHLDGVELLRLPSDLESDHGEEKDVSEEDSLNIQSCVSSYVDSDILSVASGLDLHQETSCDDGSIRSASSGDSVLEAEAIDEETEKQYPVALERSYLSDPIRMRYGVVIYGRLRAQICDYCHADIHKRGYYCRICNNGDWDMCRRCEKQGKWCSNTGHQLLDVTKGKVVGVISKDSFRVRQELNVYNMREPSGTPFRVLDSHDRILYDSPPALHPFRPLVAWALTDRKLILVDFKNNHRWEENVVEQYA